jgi:oxalate decarboxylase
MNKCGLFVAGLVALAAIPATRSRTFPLWWMAENIRNTPLRFLEIFRSSYFADISLAQWLAFTPHELVRAHLNIDESVLAKIPAHKTPVVPA